MGIEVYSENELIKAILRGQGSTADSQACKVNICQQFPSLQRNGGQTSASYLPETVSDPRRADMMGSLVIVTAQLMLYQFMPHLCFSVSNNAFLCSKR